MYAWQLGGLGQIGALAPLILIFAVFYFLMILPQQKRQKKWQKMLTELKTGDRVITQGGLRGVVVALRDDALHLRVAPDNLRIEVMRGSVQSVIPAEGGTEVTAK